MQLLYAILYDIVHNYIVSTVPISSTSTIKFNEKITLKDVLCVPSFNLNLMSISKITSSLNCCVVFTPDVAFYRTWLRGG